MYLSFQERLAKSIKKAIAKTTGVELASVTFQVPPRLELGDLAITAPFDLAKQLRRKPREIAQELAGQLKVCKMDVQEHSGVATQHQIAAIPTLMIFKGGEMVERITGLQPKKGLMDIIGRHL